MTRQAAPRPARRIQLDAVELDLRGVSADTAARAAQLLGPALAQALAGRRVEGGQRHGDIDGGRIELAPSAAPETLAALLARRIAERTSGG